MIEIKDRFRGFLPVVVDVETAGFESGRHALLEVAAVTVLPDADGLWVPGESFHAHLKPEPGLELDPAALKFNGINPSHPLRLAVSEDEGLRAIFAGLKRVQKDTGCKRCVL
ncbi:MAG: exonuclease domain-containing protein, partial [Perlucidibaca sp.]